MWDKSERPSTVRPSQASAHTRSNNHRIVIKVSNGKNTIHELILYLSDATNLCFLMRPCLPRKLRGDPQRSARRSNEHDVRKVPAQDVMRQGE